MRRRPRAGGRLLLGYATANSGMTLGGRRRARRRDARRARSDEQRRRGPRGDGADRRRPAERAIRVTKFATYQSSSSTPAAELVGRCVRTLDRFVGDGFDALLESQQTELGRFWDRADVRVVAQEDSERTQQAIRWNLFQVAQATWRSEGAGVPAKGLTGPAYEGHLLLGHRDVRARDAVLHVATDRTQPAALPATACCPRRASERAS